MCIKKNYSKVKNTKAILAAWVQDSKIWYDSILCSDCIIKKKKNHVDPLWQQEQLLGHIIHASECWKY